MKRINLLPKAERQNLWRRFFARQLFAFWVWVIISLIIFLVLVSGVKILQKQQINDVEQQIGWNKQVLKMSDNERLKQEVGDLNAEVLGIKNLGSQHYYWSAALTELANLLPANMQVDSISLDRGTGKVDIKGTAASRDSVLKFWADIHKSAYFQDIDFPLSNLNQAKDDPFSYSFYINPEKLKQP